MKSLPLNQETEWLLKEKYKGIKTSQFEIDCQRLLDGVPLAYVISHVPFLNTTIYLGTKDEIPDSPHPLIPRAETEFWVNNAISEIKRAQNEQSELNGKPIKILDLCAGSGCIGVSLLKNLPLATVDFAEIDEILHPIIVRNIKENHIDITRAGIFRGDLFQALPHTYDYIFSNPPYLDPNLTDRAEESVVNYEPPLALWGGEKGFEFIQRIIQDAPQYLNPHGVLYIEHEPEQSDAIQTLAQKNGFVCAQSDRDQYGITRTSRLAIG